MWRQYSDAYVAWHLRLGGYCYSASRLHPGKLYRAALYSVEVPCGRNMWCSLTQRSLRNLMVLGMRNITDQLLLLCWKTKVILRASGSRCSSYCLFLTEHNSCSFPWSTPAVHRASAAWGLEVESTWGPHPWYRWDYFIMIPLQCLEVRCWMMYGVFACVLSFLYPTLLWILYVFGWKGDLAL